MELQGVLLLISIFVFKGHALQCNQCIPIIGPCTNTPVDCPSQCGSATVAAVIAGQKTTLNLKSCAPPVPCVNGSVNVGTLEATMSSKCCNTDLCNNQNPPELPSQSANGKKCFTCEGNNCSKTVNCVGDEDRCVNATVNISGQNQTAKGCISRSLCDADVSAQLGAFLSFELTCCEGDLCNNAKSISESMFLLVVSSVSIIFFH